MAKTTLVSGKYKEGEYAGQTVTFPVIGEATFEKDGTLVVEGDQETIEALLKATEPSFAFKVVGAQSSKKVAPKPKKEAVKGEKEEKPKEEKKEAAPEALAELEEKLEALGVKELLELAKEAGLTEAASWSTKRLRKELLKALA